ncbi:hypothetical protein Lalb_Chr05g0228241 [Lupinus albus]|uniref:Uncharacterized protein n=1 Tax=Lupinus albus TaxID=3870 RepID=A0A6A4QJ24_LUPAL|nr:hypothetical protein Lalb_Chr05g0228241 [Lupinus albus]
MVLCFSQSKYIRDLLDIANLSSTKSSITPMANNCKISKHGITILRIPLSRDPL